MVAAIAAVLLSAFASRAATEEPGPEEEPWRFKAKSTTLQTNAEGQRIYSLVDDVVILHGDLTAMSDEARYLDDAKRAILSGHVVMWQDSTTVRGPFAYYDRETGIARFPYGVLIERPSATAIADGGIWWRDEDRFELRGNAAAADTSGTLEANVMTYEAENDLFFAVGNARLVDDGTGVIVEGQDLRYDQREGIAVVTGDPSAILNDEDGVPIQVTAVRFTYDPQENVAVANGNVRIRRQSMEATADLARFYRDENRTVLAGSPEIVDGSTVVTGERIELLMPSPERRTVRVRGKAAVSNRFLDSRVGPEPADAGPLAPDAPEAADVEGPAAADGEQAPEEPPAPLLSGEVAETALLVLEGARDRFDQAANEIRQDASVDEEPSIGADPGPLPSETARDRVEKALKTDLAGGVEKVADHLESATAAEGGAEGDEEDLRPEWLKIPSEKLPTANLLFGEEIFLVFVRDALEHVEVIGSGRSKFFPNEELGELTEWNDVVGDTLHVWFSESSVDSVTVLGSGVGEYRLPAGEDAGHSAEELKNLGKLVKYQAPRIRYHTSTETMHLDQGAEVQYKTMTLTAGRIDFEATKEIMTAGGDPSPTLVDGESTVMGSGMNYHLPSQRGEVVQGRTAFENGYYGGKDVWLMGEDTLAVDHAIYTTCDLETPHYYFSCRNMKLFLDDKMVARPVVLRIRDIPVLALPYYMASLKKKRHSGFLLPSLELGVSESNGRFIRNLGYYWAPNDYMDLTAQADFYPQQDRIVSYLTGRYNLRYKYDGRLALKYNRDVPQDVQEFAVEVEHRQQFSETASANANIRYVSSSSFYQDIDDNQRLDRDLLSFANYNKRFAGNRNLQVEARRTQNLDTGQVNEALPTIAFTQPSSPLSGSPSGESGGLLNLVYYSTQGYFTRQYERGPDPIVNPEDPEIRRATEVSHLGSKGDLNLRTVVSLHRYLRIDPTLNAELVWQDEDREGNKNAVRFLYNAALVARTELYGTMLNKAGPFQGFRHVFRPSVSWRIAPNFPEYSFNRAVFDTMITDSTVVIDTTYVKGDRFFAFGAIGATRRQDNNVSFSMDNLLQTKVLFGETERRYDFLNMRNTLSYNFVNEDNPWSTLTSSLIVLSGAAINQTWSVTHDVETWELLRTSVTTRARISSGMLGRLQAGGVGDSGVPPPDSRVSEIIGTGRGAPLSYAPAGDWSLDISHTAGPSTSNLVLNSRWAPTSKWQLSFNSQYDLRTGENTAQLWSIQRVVHCWTLSFDRRLLGGHWQYFFRINVTDIPDLQARRGDFSGSSSTTSGLNALF